MILRFAVLFALAACGAAGPPQPPTPGIAVTGEATMGVTIR